MVVCLWPCVAESQLVEQFLVISSQVEQLKVEWGLKLLDTHAIHTTKQHRDLEYAYEDRVLAWARKTLLKRMSQDAGRRSEEEVSVQE